MLVSRLTFFALLTLVATTSLVVGKPTKPDCSTALATVEAAVAATCDCAAAPNHGQFVRCAGKVVRELAKGGSLGKSCKGQMVRVFAQSSCGKAAAVTCCKAGGCFVRKATICQKVGGTPGATPFCSDACSTAGSPSSAFLD